MNKATLVLGGGGARGFYHLGVLAALRELNIKITEIIGTSAGAIAGILYAADPERDLIKLRDALPMYKLFQLPTSKRSIFKSEILIDFLKEEIGVETFKELKIPCRITCVDINKGEEIEISKGKIFPYLAASIALPGIFSPVKVGNRMLSDGGIIHSVPVHLIKKRKRVIIANLDQSLIAVTNNTSTYKVLTNAYNIQRTASTQKLLAPLIKKKKVVYIKANLEVNPLDFRASNRKKLYDKGYRAIMNRTDEILKATN